jgi:hypothetical protein
MRKVLLSVTTAAAVLAVPLALAGTASASTARPAAASYCCAAVGHDLHVWHVEHVEHEAYMAYLGGY